MADPSDDVIIVITTLGDRNSAEELVRRLIDERLIACGNIIPGLASIYRWEGEVVTEDEVLVVMKTADVRLNDLMARAAEIHPYEVPEMMALRADEVSGAYGGWVMRETSKVSA
jgi:periplasmic divalent cation tolerance protein